MAAARDGSDRRRRRVTLCGNPADRSRCPSGTEYCPPLKPRCPTVRARSVDSDTRNVAQRPGDRRRTPALHGPRASSEGRPRGRRMDARAARGCDRPQSKDHLANRGRRAPDTHSDLGGYRGGDHRFTGGSGQRAHRARRFSNRTRVSVRRSDREARPPRVRRIEMLAQRDAYAMERAALGVRWAARTESHLRFRATLQLLDLSFRELKRIGYL